MKVRLSSEARQDLIAIGDYIARDNPSRARSFVQELTNKCASLANMPLSYPVVPRYEAKGIRRRVHGNYQIFYRVDGDQVFVVRVLHGARDYEALL
ncbi:type II toxin-antitoxin system RelE/ParE family toxin (plasmid) [Burkholderia multivorans]|uniref:type II toxin-antitoxin system RelE/ParE family toxin n=1 Tax=Burkholderia multivorans TaxID=87883 RepID=UPI002018CFB1|nr:type II toxin-antitoxin system RelE/ParE family toxin [Burkholderia multivorans]MCO1345946.1 type II toxin-antitoxin system RelE/ParE family toxin [Burkholderia multivorans]MCO1445293.1 type II toxin-antitoxin system RelE/ParE family toxin [Burkholderia multivorans]UQO32597.1 type II toxin-antitoxin system RelE/ParE family toxin [Burkholderia multivorans]UQO45745.1 type II toxin-antitoxin system RelE/ParE family toxin [Burkholderia multivorans]